MSTSYKVQDDLKVAQAMTDGLADYVRGDQLYGSTGGGFFSKMPSLTVGALLMRLHRLDSLQYKMNPKQKDQFDEIYHSWRRVRDEWRSHYEQKILHEVESRLESMTAFFKECADSQQNCHSNYRPEIQKRTIVQNLLHEMDELNLQDDDLDELLKNTDGKLRTYLRSDSFQWADELQGVYPKSDYWWLYQKPPKALHEN